jgi:RNA polymerase sigma factor (sigma-70 family)
MMIEVLKSKIHCAQVTQANLNYIGSITIDEDLMDAANMIEGEKVQIVRQLIDALPEKQRACMQLRDIEGKTYKDIATVLGITEEQVKVNIFRARQTIKQQFERYDNYGL